MAVYRRRQEAATGARRGSPRASAGSRLTVYACDGCGARAVGEQRCERVPNPDAPGRARRSSARAAHEPVAVDELLGQEVIA